MSENIDNTVLNLDMVEMKTSINILVFTNKDGEKTELEYENVWYIENNGLEVFLDANKYNVNNLSSLFPEDIFEGHLAVKNVPDSAFSYHNNLICQSIALKTKENIIQVTLPGISEEVRKYMTLQAKVEQLQANIDYLAMETDIELEL